MPSRSCMSSCWSQSTSKWAILTRHVSLNLRGKWRFVAHWMWHKHFFLKKHNYKMQTASFSAVGSYLLLSAGLAGTALCRGSNSSSCWIMDLALTWTPEILMLIPRRFPGPLAGETACVLRGGWVRDFVFKTVQIDGRSTIPSTGFSFICSSCSCTAVTQLEWISSPSLFRSAMDLSTSSESLAMASSLNTMTPLNCLVCLKTSDWGNTWCWCSHVAEILNVLTAREETQISCMLWWTCEWHCNQLATWFYMKTCKNRKAE